MGFKQLVVAVSVRRTAKLHAVGQNIQSGHSHLRTEEKKNQYLASFCSVLRNKGPGGLGKKEERTFCQKGSPKILDPPSGRGRYQPVDI